MILLIDPTYHQGNDGKLISNNDLVDDLVIHAHAPTFILL